MSEEELKQIARVLKINPVAVEKKLITFIKNKVRESGADGVVIGLSGGIDSSVTAVLCVRALGPEKVLGISLPEVGVSDPSDVADARLVAEKLGIDFRVIDIAPVVKALRGQLEFKPEAKLPNANILPRVRMVVLYYYANMLNRLVVGCSNRSELRTGYFTKYGDGASDLAPLGALYKTQVRELACYLGIPKQIVDKTPTAGLWPGQTDEGELGISYKNLDMIFAGLDLGLKPVAIAKTVGLRLDEVKSIVERERRSLHKLRPPEIPKL
ncbi:MAG: NAD+ synthase [Candidatus Hadarchaeum sp.]|uniref:NAD+ synthase n=1 Tax=Candidatus Hadarchaeum sp. TaxID=2883567 RepID=UPI003171C7E4